MAEDIIDKAIEIGKIRAKPCCTKDFSIHGNLPKNQVNRDDHLYIYGADISEIKRLQAMSPEYATKIHPNHEATFAEVAWAVNQEMAQTVEDTLARRIRFLFTDARAAIDSALPVAEFMAKELDKSPEW